MVAAMVEGARPALSKVAARSPPSPETCYTFPADVPTNGPKMHALERIITDRYGGRDLPVTLVLPDGGARAAVAIARGRHRRAHLEGLARARQAGDGLARARLRARRHRLHRQRAARRSASPSRWSARSSTAASALGAQLAAVRAPAAQQPRATSRTTTTSPTRSTACGSTSAWCIRARISRATTTRSTRRRREARPHLPQAAPRAGREFLDIGCGWGGLIFHAAENYGVQAHRHHAVAEPVRPRQRARSRRAACRARARRAASTTRPARRASCTTRSRASACSSTSASRASRATSARSTAC